MSDLQGKKILDYTLQRLLGMGGMAEVWYAENVIGKRAAVKLLLPKFCADEAVVERFLNEAKVMVKLSNNNIRQVFSYDTIDGRPAIVMEYLEGYDLKTRMKNGQSFTHDELVKWWNQLVDALNYTHKKGIVHRDIKPSNIFVDEEGNIKLLDFGIAKVRESISSTQTGQKLGTLMYMSPEQVNDSKHIDYHTDIYSLAVTFVQLLTGKKPYDSDTSSDFQIMTSIVNKPLDLSGVPAQWRGFLEPYLEKEPSKRLDLRYFEAVETDRCPSPKPDANPVQHSDKKSSQNPHNSVETKTDDEATIAGGEFVDNDATIGAVETDENPSPNKKKSLTWLWILLGVLVLGVGVFELIKNKVTFKNKSFTVNGVTFDMIAVKGGTFTMGCTDVRSIDDESDEKPTHSVTLSNYYIGKFEVTQELWYAVMGNNPSYYKGFNLPVEQVNWNDIQKFITKLNQLTGHNFRLPTEAEWEYAARGGNKSRDYIYSGSNNVNEVAWYEMTSKYDGTKPVGTKASNELGIYDMSGNVWEWCQDWYGSYSSWSRTNPQGPSSGSNRVLRGGSWGKSAWYCRVSNRDNYYDPDERSYIGFRLVLEP